jgi:hypothetical protein
MKINYFCKRNNLQQPAAQKATAKASAASSGFGICFKLKMVFTIF